MERDTSEEGRRILAGDGFILDAELNRPLQDLPDGESAGDATLDAIGVANGVVVADETGLPTAVAGGGPISSLTFDFSWVLRANYVVQSLHPLGRTCTTGAVCLCATGEALPNRILAYTVRPCGQTGLLWRHGRIRRGPSSPDRPSACAKTR